MHKRPRHTNHVKYMYIIQRMELVTSALLLSMTFRLNKISVKNLSDKLLHPNNTMNNNMINHKMIIITIKFKKEHRK